MARFSRSNYAEQSPRLTHFLISIVVAVFLLEVYFGYAFGQEAVLLLFQNYGFSLAGFMSGNWWTPITSIFLHAGPEHLLLNMFALYFFGRVVEQELGWKKMLLIFIATGAAGDAALSTTALLGLSSPLIPTIGASAAIFGLLGVAMFLKPMEFVIYPYIIPVPLILVALLYVLYNVIAFAAILTTGQESEIAYVAHIGGLAAGIIIGLKTEGKKRGAIILLSFILLVIIILAASKYISLLEGANYLSIFSSALK